MPALLPAPRRSWLLLAGCAGFAALAALGARPSGHAAPVPTAAATAVPGGPAACPEPPTAWVLEGDRPMGARTTAGAAGAGAAALLRAAGFSVQPLPLDRSPFDLRGLVFIGSFASAAPGYAAYMRAHAADLYGFVDRGNVLVEMPQAAAREPSPPFLPTTHLATRRREPLGGLHLLERRSPLLAGPAAELADLPRLAREAGGPLELFDTQAGFEVSLAADPAAARPVLMEGAYGQGRIVLAALPFDAARPQQQPALAALAARLARNLRAHVGDVCRRRTAPLALTPASAAPAIAPGSWTLAVLPDTQVYALVYPGVFTAQTAWIAANAQRLSIRYVLHLGDIVNNNTELEWRRAASAMALLDGRVPYALVPGNHDYGPSGDASTRDTLLNSHFSYAEVTRWSSFGGAHQRGRLDNTYHLFSAAGRDYIVLALEWAPRDEVVDWANRVMAAHPRRLGILVTHAYLDHDGRRDDIRDRGRPQPFNPHQYATPGGINDGQQLWDRLVRHHRFIMVLNGHALGDGAGYLVSATDAGTLCHQMLSNYQMRQLGGGGYLRLIQFLPDGDTVRVHSYSPIYDRFLWEPDQAFSFALAPRIARADTGAAPRR
jgi:3',5'-cyclic AMP phosphodiesterase CpdA